VLPTGESTPSESRHWEMRGAPYHSSANDIKKSLSPKEKVLGERGGQL
jgi:hypothetical protein